MAPRSFLLDDVLTRYVLDHTATPDEVARSLFAETAALGAFAGMQVAPDEGAFLGLMTRLVGARSAVEVGTFTGYSSLCIARNLAPGGRLLCCDVSEEWTAIGRRHWERAGVADRIDLRIAPAAETLAALPDDPTIDLCFIDADKTGYSTYWNLLVPRVRPGGVLLVDNVLWSGRVVDDSDQSDDTRALRAFADEATADDRVELVMLSAFDGLLFAVRR
jgi:caffeoyl-CoA O-methyltransferase